MSKKSVITLWMIAVILGVGVTILKLRKTDSGEANTNRNRGETLFESFPSAKVNTVKISALDQSVTLTQKDNQWVVAERGNYPANKQTLFSLLRTIEEVKINNAIDAGPTYAKRFGIDLTAKTQADHGIQLSFLDAQQENLATLFLGKESDGGGRFVQNAADTSGYYVTSESFPTATADPKNWLNMDFIKVDKIKSIAITAAGKPDQQEWKLTRSDENAEFTLEGAKDNEKLDTNITSPLKTILSAANFQDVLSSTDVATVEKAADRRIVTIDTVDGFQYIITLVAKPALAVSEAIAKPDDTAPPAEDSFQMTVKVSATLAKERSKAADEKPEDAKVKDEEFQKNLKTLEDKLKAEQTYQQSVYEVSKYTVDGLLKARAELLSKEAPAAPATPGTPGQPGVTTPPSSSGPVEAVTPPVSIDQ